MASASEQQLKQDYAQRIHAFRSLFVKHLQAQDCLVLLPDAIVLATDLLDSYENVSNIAQTFQDELQDPEFENGMFAVFMHSISMNHERFDKCLLEIHRDYEALYPHQLLASRPRQKAMMSYYIPATVPPEKLSEELRPKLWSDSGQLLHDPEAFSTTHGGNIRQQLKVFFAENGEALSTILHALPSLKNATRDKMVALLLDNVVEHHLPVDDSRRLAISPFISVKDEALSRLQFVLQNLNGDYTEAERFQQIDHLFEVVQSLGIDDTDEVLLRLVACLKQIDLEPARIVLYDSGVSTLAHLLKRASWQGLDQMKVFQGLLETSTHRIHDVVTAAAAQIPLVRFDQYAGGVRRVAMYAAFLMNQNDGILLKSQLSDQTLLTLYVLKGNEQFKEALKTPERADTLLAHELGL